MRKIFLLLLCAALSACDSSVDVDATANVPAQYSSVLVTVKEVWFNESATAVPEDTTWEKFPLAEPVTLNLTEGLSGTLSDVASQLELSAGEYRQVRLYLADRSDALAGSASAASAKYNNQVTYFDANGTETTLPLEVANAAQGIGIQTNLNVAPPTDAILAASVSAGTGTSGASGTSIIGGTSGASGTSVIGGTTGTTLNDSTVVNGTTGTSGASGSSGASDIANIGTSTSSPTTTTTTGTTLFATDTTPQTTVTATSQIVFDAARDLTPFRFGDQPGFLLNPTIAAYDADEVGAIQGQLDLSALSITTGTSRPDIQVTAEKLNDDSTRRVLVASAPVSADGRFVLYPLPMNSTDSDVTAYDLVIHGPGIRTVILRSVPVTAGEPGNATDIAIGTLTLAPADSYAVNLTADSTAGTGGSRVGFYQTLPDDDAPFLIELRTVDPLTGRFAADESLSAATTVSFATYSSSFSFQQAAPQEGASKYSVAAQAPLYGEGTFANVLVAPPATAGSASTFTVPSVAIPDTASSGTIAASVSVASPGKYDKGALIVTHDGAVVSVTSLDELFAQSQPTASIDVTDVPASTAAGFAEGYYYLEVWAWNSADPAGTFSRQPSATAVDLRSTLTANASVTVN